MEVRRIDREGEDLLPALRLVTGAGRLGDEKQVRGILQAVEEGRSSIDLLYGVYEQGRLCGAVLALESPGRAALLMLPPRLEPGVETTLATAVGLLRREAWSRGLLLLQALTEPGSVSHAAVLQRSGFQYVTRLIYLRASLVTPFPEPRCAEGLTWVDYRPEREELFRRALSLSYVQSLDCPELTGIRSVADTLAAHRASGVFTPEGWWVA
ncbi:MAG: hypothetical protein D6788_01455, partial [Planctomycetota bacterium]